MSHRRLGGALLALGGLVYLGAEAISALAWKNPSYSYRHDYVSDLGIPHRAFTHGHSIESPLHTVMNSGLIIDGVLFVSAAWLLTERKSLFGALAALHGIGNIMVALVPETSTASFSSLHDIGALISIVGGNLAIAAYAKSKIGFIAAGFGLISFVVMLAHSGSSVGLLERAAIYPITGFELVAGYVKLSQRE